MDTYYNYKEYNKFITDKYQFSEKEYKKVFDKEDPQVFLSYYEGMNVYPVYPRAIIMPLKKAGEGQKAELKSNSSLKFQNDEMVKISKYLETKLDEFATYTKTMRELSGEDKIRRFFNYELRDEVAKVITDYKITNTPFGRDLIGELVEACHEEDMSILFYYSQPDWHHPNYVHNRGAFKDLDDPPDTDVPDWDRYIDYYFGQVRELCTNYGFIDGIWFDGSHKTERDWRGREV